MSNQVSPQDRLNRPLDYWRRHQKLRFLVIGAWNTGVGYLGFAALYLSLHTRLPYLLIGAMAHLIATVNAFITQRWLVFGSQRKWRAELLRFATAQLLVLGCGLVALWLLVSVANLSPLISPGLVSIGTVVISWYAHRNFSFAVTKRR